MRSKLNGRNKIMAVNIWAVSLMRFGAGISKWNTNELQKLDRKTKQNHDNKQGTPPKKQCCKNIRIMEKRRKRSVV